MRSSSEFLRQRNQKIIKCNFKEISAAGIDLFNANNRNIKTI